MPTQSKPRSTARAVLPHRAEALAREPAGVVAFVQRQPGGARIRFWCDDRGDLRYKQLVVAAVDGNRVYALPRAAERLARVLTVPVITAFTVTGSGAARRIRAAAGAQPVSFDDVRGGGAAQASAHTLAA